MAQTKILVIEDDFLLLEMYSISLQQDDYLVFKASNAVEGYKLIDSEKPDIILLDLNMPSVSGYQVLSDLKDNGNETPVLVISNTDEQTAIDRCLELGARDYVVKARTNLEQIKDIIKKHLPDKQ